MASENEDYNFGSSLKLIQASVYPTSRIEYSTTSSYKEYQEEIQNLSIKLSQADSIVKELIFSQEKIKQSLSQSRVENSNLILVNRSLRTQLLNLGSKVEENDKIIKKLGKLESFKEQEINESCEKCKEREVRGRLRVEKGKGVLVVGKKRVERRVEKRVEKKKISFCVMQHQFDMDIGVGNFYKKKERFRKMEVSRTTHCSFLALKAELKMRVESSLKIYTQKTIKFQQLFRMESENFSYFPIVSKHSYKFDKIEEPEYKFVEKVIEKKKVSYAKIEKISNFGVSAKKYQTPDITKPTEPLKLFLFPIFTSQPGRCQAEKLDSDDENNLDVIIPKRHFDLSISRTIKSAYIPKIRKFTIKLESILSISPPISRKKPRSLKTVTKPVTLSFTPKPIPLNKQIFKIVKKKARPLKQEFFASLNFCPQLSIQKCKGFNIVQEFFSNGEEFEAQSIESQSPGKPKRIRRPAKRASAIDEYFTLVILTQTFQAAKLNFPDKDKISNLKSTDLYTKVQQLKLPFNFWHDWIKEQFNFMCRDKQ